MTRSPVGESRHRVSGQLGLLDEQWPASVQSSAASRAEAKGPRLLTRIRQRHQIRSQIDTDAPRRHVCLWFAPLPAFPTSAATTVSQPSPGAKSPAPPGSAGRCRCTDHTVMPTFGRAYQTKSSCCVGVRSTQASAISGSALLDGMLPRQARITNSLANDRQPPARWCSTFDLMQTEIRHAGPDWICECGNAAGRGRTRVNTRPGTGSVGG